MDDRGLVGFTQPAFLFEIFAQLTHSGEGQNPLGDWIPAHLLRKVYIRLAKYLVHYFVSTIVFDLRWYGDTLVLLP
jgi:hypothetical protein